MFDTLPHAVRQSLCKVLSYRPMDAGKEVMSRWVDAKTGGVSAPSGKGENSFYSILSGSLAIKNPEG